jgi:hypothetical protein
MSGQRAASQKLQHRLQMLLMQGLFLQGLFFSCLLFARVK